MSHPVATPSHFLFVPCFGVDSGLTLLTSLIAFVPRLDRSLPTRQLRVRARQTVFHVHVSDPDPIR